MINPEIEAKNKALLSATKAIIVECATRVLKETPFILGAIPNTRAYDKRVALARAVLSPGGDELYAKSFAIIFTQVYTTLNIDENNNYDFLLLNDICKCSANAGSFPSLQADNSGLQIWDSIAGVSQYDIV